MELQSKADEDRDHMLKQGDRIDDLQTQLKKSEVENLSLKESLHQTKLNLEDREDDIVNLKDKLRSLE